MDLERRLILNKFILNLFGFQTFVNLKEMLKDQKEGFENDGRSYFVNVLIGLEHLRIPTEEILNKEDLRLESFILSVSKYKDIKKTYAYAKKEKKELEKEHVLFMEDKDLVENLLKS